MSKRALALGAVALLGCAERPGAVVARVEHHTLPVNRLAELMVLAQPVPLTPDAAYQLASHWVTLTAFARRMAAGDSLLDSAQVLELMWHRVRQAKVAEWRRRLLARRSGQGSKQTAQLDSSLARQLLQQKHAELHAGASAIVRRIAADPWRPVDSALTLATFYGGAITAARVARHVQYLSPTTRQEMNQAPDDRIMSFLWGLTLEELLLGQADSVGVRLSESAYRALAGECREGVHAFWSYTGLSPAALAQAGGSPAERQQRAVRLVDRYLDAAAARKVPLQAMPPFLAVPLLRSVDWEIKPQQLDAVLDRARRLIAATGDAGAGGKR
jgi:hypothetical protein